MRRRAKILCETMFKNHRTCFAKRTELRCIPCPLCEGFREGKYENGQPIYVAPPPRRLIGWVPAGGIQKPIYSEGERARV